MSRESKIIPQCSKASKKEANELILLLGYKNQLDLGQKRGYPRGFTSIKSESTRGAVLIGLTMQKHDIESPIELFIALSNYEKFKIENEVLRDKLKEVNVISTIEDK